MSSRIKNSVHRVQKHFASQRAVILMYHRIAEVNFDPWGLCVAPINFSEQLEVLKTYTYPLSLKQLMKAFRDHDVPKNAVVVTFDDGYADNFYQAKPILERYEIPATIFVSTGYIGKESEFWWDELERLILQPKELPEELILDINGYAYKWNLGKAAYYSEVDNLRDKSCYPWEAKPDSRLSIFYSIWEQLRPLSYQHQRNILDQLQNWNASALNSRSSYRPLSSEELFKLGTGSLIEIGAHTVTHPFLSAHSKLLQKNEIEQSKFFLENFFNYPITSFSYPFGNFTSEAMQLTRSAGFDCACSTAKDIVWRQSDRFQLPRLGVENWNGEEFCNQLFRWFDD